jgi:hypothetical protein
MKQEVLLFAEEIVCDSRPQCSSAQGQVFFGKCTQTGQKIVIKQINIQENPDALIKELQVFNMYINSMNAADQPHDNSAAEQLNQEADRNQI